MSLSFNIRNQVKFKLQSLRRNLDKDFFLKMSIKHNNSSSRSMPHKILTQIMRNRIGVVMVGLLVLSALDCGFEHRSGQTKDNKIDICCISAKHTALRKKQRLLGSESP